MYLYGNSIFSTHNNKIGVVVSTEDSNSSLVQPVVND